MSLRTRLVFGAAAAVALAIILASLLVYFLVENDLRGQVDASLRENATTISQQPRGFGALYYAPKVYELITETPPFIGYYQLVNAAGDVYIPGGFVHNPPLLAVDARVMAVAAGHAKAFFYDTVLEQKDTRVFTIPTQILTRSRGAGFGLPSSERAAIQVALPLTGVDQELSKIRLWLLLVALGGVALASGAGFLVARSTLRPVRDLSDAAERVRATRDLSQRISVGGSDELSQLALTFNEMLAALDDAAKRQQQLVQDASHELRTPLTSLRTNIEVLANGDALPAEERAQLLHDVVEQLGEMTALVSELTELARGEQQGAALEEARLDLIAEDAVRRTSRNHPEVVIDTELVPTTVIGTPANLERAIANLLDNAAKWSPPGSTVEVRVKDAELTVRDHGPGIAEADVPHIFERFYRAASARSMPGSGLGLAIVHQVAESHGGTIAFEPARGGGTLMRLRLPAADGSRPPIGADHASAPGRSETGLAEAGSTVRSTSGSRAAFAGVRERLRAPHGSASPLAHGREPSRRTLWRRGG